MMVDGLWMLLCWVRPGFDHFQDKEVELVDETGIDHLAFKVGKALGHQRRRHTLSWHRRQAESLELVHVPPEQLPIPTTLGANSTSGMAITHSFVARRAVKL